MTTTATALLEIARATAAHDAASEERQRTTQKALDEVKAELRSLADRIGGCPRRGESGAWLGKLLRHPALQGAVGTAGMGVVLVGVAVLARACNVPLPVVSSLTQSPPPVQESP